MGATQRVERRQALVRRAVAATCLPPTDEARMRQGRRVLLAAYGQTEQSLEVLVRVHRRFLESARARQTHELANGADALAAGLDDDGWEGWASEGAEC